MEGKPSQETEITAVEMTPEQVEAYHKYIYERPTDPAERQRLRDIFLKRNDE